MIRWSSGVNQEKGRSNPTESGEIKNEQVGCQICVCGIYKKNHCT